MLCGKLSRAIFNPARASAARVARGGLRKRRRPGNQSNWIVLNKLRVQKRIMRPQRRLCGRGDCVLDAAEGGGVFESLTDSKEVVQRMGLTSIDTRITKLANFGAHKHPPDSIMQTSPNQFDLINGLPVSPKGLLKLFSEDFRKNRICLPRARRNGPDARQQRFSANRSSRENRGRAR